MWWIDHHCTLCSCFYFFYIFHFSFILKCFSCREHLSQNQMFIFIQIGSCGSSLKWCSSGSLCEQMCCDWKPSLIIELSTIKVSGICLSYWSSIEDCGCFYENTIAWILHYKYMLKSRLEIWAKFSADCRMSKVFLMLKWGESCLRLLIYC